jgi:hypothetical protein
MKKWLTLMVLSAAVAATVGLSSRVAAQPDREPTEAEVNAAVDARLQEVMHAVLAGHRPDASPVALHR